MAFSINPEQDVEYPIIHDLVKAAFEKAPHADGDEHTYVSDLRLTERYIPDLALTLKDGEKIVGHIMFTKTYIDQKGEMLEALLLSPVCMAPAYQNKGLGSKLIQAGLLKAMLMGYKAVFLVGEPGYYSRFGFTSINKFGIKDTGDIPIEYTQALELEAGYLRDGGIISIC
jgi:putative acetyltransferase